MIVAPIDPPTMTPMANAIIRVAPSRSTWLLLDDEGAGFVPRCASRNVPF